MGGFIERLRDGTWMGHILEHVGIELQNLAGSKVGFGKTRQIGDTTVYKMAMRTRSEVVGRAAIEAGRELLLAAVNDQPFDLAASVATISRLVDRHCFGPSTACIVDAAVERKIPWISLNGGNLVQLGHGLKQRRIWTAETDRTSAIAEGIASDKDMTKMLLASCGVPVPQGQIVASPQAAWEAAEEIGLPVVVKPSNGNHGRGISLDLTAQADVEAAFPFAARHGSEVIVERYVPGNEHRLLVVGGKLVAAARGESAWVTGDGTASIRQLVDRDLNSDPRRGTTEDHPLSFVRVDSDTAVATEIARQGFTNDAVPPAGQRVLIARNGNVAFDCTELVHPEVAAAVGLAARIVGLDIAGIDLVAEDISRPLQDQGGAIVEVNAGPGLLMHLRPAGGTAQPVGKVIAAHLFPEGEDGRIPIVGVAGSRDSHGTTSIARLIAWLLRVSGKRVGLACADGVFIDRRQTDTRSGVRFDVAQSVLMNPTIEAAVIESNAEAILRDGLPFDRCRVAVVTDISFGTQKEALGAYHIEDNKQLFSVMRGPVDTVLAEGLAVLNADEPATLDLVELCDGDVVLYSLSASSPAIADHRAKGRRCVLIDDGRIVLAAGERVEVLESLDELIGQCPGVLPEHVLAAVATTWGMGLLPELIAAGIKTYAADRRAALVA